MSQLRLFAALLLLALLTGRCSLTDYHSEQTLRSPRAFTTEERRLVESNNRFGFDLFRAASEAEDPGQNVFISPLSVSMALAMTLNGARGETREAMLKTLALSGFSTEATNAAYERLIRVLGALDPDVTLELANSIWYRKNLTVDSDFVETNRNHFDAEVRALTFGSPDAISTINQWVDAQTHGKIDRIVDRIYADEVMLLVNALYFKGTWTYAFDKADTRKAPFTRHDGTTTQVPTMQQTATLPYFETEAFQAVDLPYGDSLYNMTVFLPRPNHSVDALADTLDAERWSDWSARFEPRAVELRLPRFALEYEKQLNDVLGALGMAIAFDCRSADFSGISAQGGLCISRVKHKSFVEVSEEGTEAAAATSVGIQTVSTGSEAVAMHVDRPFVFVVHERHSGAIVFAGRVSRL